ncbi:WD repeat-containing protein 82 [Borealophlyctis nickersoniae]|nr:WD repeat-containing protein 82 [Borealophlyctis nickersoniae]
MSPQDDLVFSGSFDGTVRLWDLRSNSCQGLLNLPTLERPSVAIDKESVVFGVSCGNYINMYDVRSFDKGPFTTFEIKDADGVFPEICAMKFSNDGQHLCVSTRGEIHYVLDSFGGDIKFRLTGHENNTRVDLVADFTPDSKFVLSGSSDGMVYFWDLENEGTSFCQHMGHEETPRVVAFNPVYTMFASACSNLAFWIADLDSLRLG